MSQKKTKSIHRFYPMALTISGSDSGGGSGIEADLRTFNAYGVYACCAITSIASQNPRRISRIDQMPQESVKSQIDTVMECFSPAFAKSGMLGSSEMVRVAADAVKKYKLRLICDPVMRCSSGSGLLPADAIEVLKNELLPQAEWITSGIEEAEILLGNGYRIVSEKDLFEAALLLHKSFGTSVLIKGGNINPSEASDAVCRDGKLYRLTSPRTDVPESAAHGAGCTLSAAVTAGLTLDYPWKQVLCEAKSFVLGSLAQNVELASGVFAMYPPTEDCYDQVRLVSAEF